LFFLPFNLPYGTLASRQLCKVFKIRILKNTVFFNFNQGTTRTEIAEFSLHPTIQKKKQQNEARKILGKKKDEIILSVKKQNNNGVLEKDIQNVFFCLFSKQNGCWGREKKKHETLMFSLSNGVENAR